MNTIAFVTKHRQDMSNQVAAGIPGFDQNNPQHMQSLTQTLREKSYEVAFYTMSGESLLARARNHCAQTSMAGDWDKCFFIDSDTGWSVEDFRALVDSPYHLAAGVVPLKTFPNYPHNFATSLNFLPFRKDEVYFDRALRTLQSTVQMAQANKSPWLKVAFTGTGFLCVDTSVFVTMAETAEKYSYPNPTTGQPETHWSFFDGGPMNGQYFSEDWRLCHRARQLGYDIMINSNVRPTHTGWYTYQAR